MFDTVVHKIELVKKKTTQLSAKSTPSKKNNFIVIKSTHFVPHLTQLSAKSTWSQKPTWFQTIDSIVVKIDSICTTFHLIYLPLTGPLTCSTLFELILQQPSLFFILFLTELILWTIKSILGMHTTHFFWIDNFETNGLPYCTSYKHVFTITILSLQSLYHVHCLLFWWCLLEITMPSSVN